MKKLTGILVILFFFGLVFSCRRASDKPLWDTDVVAPLFQSSLSISNIIRDTATFKVNSDQSITIVERQLLMKVGMDSIIKNISADFQESISPTNLTLGNRSDTSVVTLAQLANAAGPPIGPALVFYNHNTLPVFPGISNYSLPPQDINISNYLQAAEIISGSMSITIINNFPIEISNMNLAIQNKSNSSSIWNHTYTNIQPGDSSYYSQSLAGVSIQSALQALITQLSFPPAANVPIDLNDKIQVIIKVNNVKVSSAKAVFPTTTFLDTTSKRVFTTLGDVQLKKVTLATANVKIEMSNTLGENINFNYKIPRALKDGVPLEINSTIPLGSVASPSSTTLNIDMAGYDIDLTGIGGADTVNTFYDVVKAGTVYSGNLVSLSVSDQITVKVTFENVKPSYAKGYLGQKTIQKSDPVFITLFNHITGGNIDVEQNSTKIVIDNGLGVASAVKMQDIVVKNTKRGTSLLFTNPTKVNTNLPVTPATDAPLTSTTTNIDLTSGSNSNDIPDIQPDRIDYLAQYISNPAGNTNTFTDFAYNTSSMDVYLDIEFPLSIKTNNLSLCDTVAFNSQATPNSKQPVKKGTLQVYVQNGFPLDANMKMQFLDESGTIVDSLISSGSIRAAAVDASNGRVTKKESSMISFDADETKLHNILYSKKVIFTIGFTTMPTNNYVKIYSDYSIDFKLVGDIRYSVQ